MVNVTTARKILGHDSPYMCSCCCHAHVCSSRADYGSLGGAANACASLVASMDLENWVWLQGVSRDSAGLGEF
jgi:hypothetical protein